MQSTHETAPHLAELKRALGDTEVDASDLEEEFQKYLDYGVPPEQAVKTILRHHGVQTAAPAPVSNEPVTLADVPADAPYVNLVARVITLNHKTVNARGEEKEIVWGMLGDQTATRSYTSWRPMEGVEVGDVLAVQGAYTKSWNGEIQVQFGDRCKFEKQPAETIPDTPTELREVHIGDIQIGLRGLTITGRILDVAPREVQVQGEPKTLWSGTIADETGKVEFTSWFDHKLEANTVVTIAGGYVRAFRNLPQFTFDEEATVTAADVELPSAAKLAVTKASPLWQVAENGGRDITSVATLLEVRDGSGLVFRCSEGDCSRVLVSGACRLHGKQAGRPDLRIKGVLDDGTAAVNVIIGREITESLLGKDLAACEAEAKEAFRPEIIQEQLQEMLAGRPYTVIGNVLKDEYGTMFLARSMVPATTDAEAAAEAILAAMGGN